MYFCKMNVWIDTISDALWGWCLIFVLIGCALWFTLRSKGVQFRMIGEMFRLLGESTQKKDGQHHVSLPLMTRGLILGAFSSAS